MKRIAVCVGGRPNYVKLAPIVRAMDAADDLECVLVGERKLREDVAAVLESRILAGESKLPPCWDGNASERIIEILRRLE